MQSQKAWLATIAAVLGIAEACHTRENPAAVREVTPSASAISSAIVEAVAPSTSAASDLAIPPASVAASASAAPIAHSADVQQQLIAALAASGGVGHNFHAACGGTAIPPPALTRIGNSCGVSASCGATRTVRAPSAQVATQITGGQPNDERVIALTRPRFRSCANRALNANPTEQGKLVLRVAVAANGEVTDASIVNNAGLSAASAACMASSLRRAQFDAGPARTIAVTILQTISNP